MAREACAKCAGRATHVPRLSLFAFNGASPGVFIIWRPSCAKHFPVVDELVSDAGWSQMVTTMVAAKKLAPKRELTTVTMIPIKSAEAKQFDARRRERFGLHVPGVH